ncbi:MAG: hypothetical protein K9M99_12820 [Candidatus Cloacimonetes bacterium]|nr:hypothetical protein [Candidatus Cloacimonadota bacterium]
MIDHLISNAYMVVDQFQKLTDFEFGFNEQSVEWVDGFINRQRERNDFSLESGAKMTSTLGSFLGQCIVICYGGKWEQTPEGWAITFKDGNRAYPFNKTSKHFENGIEDSIYSFFTSIPMIFNKSTKKRKRFWK